MKQIDMNRPPGWAIGCLVMALVALVRDGRDPVARRGWLLVGDEVRMYYAGADTCMALATAPLSDVLDALGR